jgi:sulfopyruvate decarboxylase subunit beta
MQRLECLRAIYGDIESCIVVTIMGAVAAELQSLGHRPNHFYLQHAMGLASSTGLGIALCVPGRKVVVLDGDGSLLMNLGTLTTLARYRPPNLIEVVFDNESLLSVGGFPTATSTGSDLAALARAAGITQVSSATNVEEFRSQFSAAMKGIELATIVAKVEAVGPAKYVTGLGLLENRYEFARHVRSLRKS